MNLKECYAALGGNYESAVSRLISESLVQKFLFKFLDDKSYENLVNSLNAKDFKEAFRAAHTIKGICQNLSLDKLHRSSSALTEALRNEVSPDYLELADAVTQDYITTVSSIRELKHGKS
jgi:HPt (histidine-containing phosphotransfer) domain-containing protein